MRTFVHSIRTLVLMCAFASFNTPAYSQAITTGNGKYEIGIGIGPLVFLGDLGGNHGVGKTFLKDVNLPMTRMVKGAFLNAYPTEWLGFRLAVNVGTLEANDAIIKDGGGPETSRKKRNLQFKSPLTEALLAAEIYPTVIMEQYEGLKGKFRPYGLIGIGLFRINPKGEYFSPNGTSTWVPLQPLRLEGQGMNEYPDRQQYQLTQIAIPMGFGFKYYFAENKYLGFEILHRKTFTDYIDDVSTNYIDANLFDQYLTAEQAQIARQLYFREDFSGPLTRPSTPGVNEQRGDPSEMDSYFSSVLRMGWRLNSGDSPASRAARQLRCPTFY